MNFSTEKELEDYIKQYNRKNMGEKTCGLNNKVIYTPKKTSLKRLNVTLQPSEDTDWDVFKNELEKLSKNYGITVCKYYYNGRPLKNE